MHQVIVGQDKLLQRMFIALLGNGHLLIEGVPGLAKTLAVSSLAKGMNTSFQRLQFTPDLLPADLTGTLMYRQDSGEFVVNKGPIFSSIILADEIKPRACKSTICVARSHARTASNHWLLRHIRCQIHFLYLQHKIR